jgi:ubiquinone/menaquinone biosynthesis C-methylase UbiE
MAHAIRSLVGHHGGPDMGGLAQHPAIYDAVASRIGRGLYRRAVADLGLVRLDRDALVVDLGTGPGRVPLMIAAALEGVRVEGVDLSAEMIERARALVLPSGVDPSRVSFRVADVAALPYAEASVAVVVSTASMHHWQDIEAGVSEIARVLRPGGQAIVYDPWSSIRKAMPAAEAAGLAVRTQALRFGIARLTLFAPI